MNDCKEAECGLYAHVIKSRQIMHLYINGELKDSFDISTGLKQYSTPEMSRKPNGPVVRKYTSKKFPGGNYKGLGNMPYAVFIKGGYAIHGTTLGNIKKLGQTASHRCIRLHPDNARLFYELVKVFGLKKTWVKVSE
jgi:lipoprotein-anchoring transpeptidase ErfK/SrfK